MATPESSWERADLVPRPDPTKLTTEAVERATLQYRRELTALRELLDVRITNLSLRLDERHAAQVRALDAAFAAAEKSVTAALSSAEKAVTKAELANEARFQGVNEFRQALTDQTRTFVPQAEYSTAHKAVEDKITANADRLTALELRLTSRLDLDQGSTAGASGQRTESLAARGQLSQTVIMIVMALSALIAIVSVIAFIMKK